MYNNNCYGFKINVTGVSTEIRFDIPWILDLMKSLAMLCSKCSGVYIQMNKQIDWELYDNTWKSPIIQNENKEKKKKNNKDNDDEDEEEDDSDSESEENPYDEFDFINMDQTTQTFLNSELLTQGLEYSKEEYLNENKILQNIGKNCISLSNNFSF